MGLEYVKFKCVEDYEVSIFNDKYRKGKIYNVNFDVSGGPGYAYVQYDDGNVLTLNKVTFLKHFKSLKSHRKKVIKDLQL